MNFLHFLDNFINLIYNFLNFMSGFFKEKSRLFFEIRKILKPIEYLHYNEYIWFHVSSAGELEQSIPIMEKFHNLGFGIVVSYFSPSTLPFLKRIPLNSISFPLPFVKAKNLENYLHNIKITKAIFVKYEVWPSIIRFCQKKQIPFFYLFVKGNNLKNNFFKRFFRSIWDYPLYRKAEKIFCIDIEDYQYFKNKVGVQSVVLSGDTKWERALFHSKTAVHNISQDSSLLNAKKLCEKLKKKGQKIIIFGSPHTEESLIFKNLTHLDGLFIIIAPHETNPTHIKKITNHLDSNFIDYTLLSELYNPNDQTLSKKSTVLIVDRIGCLASLYSISDIAIVGGGFDGQIHNVLEPSAHGTPTLFGLNHSKAPEASQLIRFGCAKEFETPELLETYLVSLAKRDNSFDPLNEGLIMMKKNALDKFNNLPESSKIICNSVLGNHFNI